MLIQVSALHQIIAHPIRVLIALIALLAPLSAASYTSTTYVFATLPDSTQLELDLYRPTAASGAIPLIIYVHGGGWYSSDKGAILGGFVDDLNALIDAGYAVASINYRLTLNGGKWPTFIHDCKGAVRYLRANATTLQIDPNRIGAWGTSAGGHLVECMGTMGLTQTVVVGDRTIDLEGTVGGNAGVSSAVQAVSADFGPSSLLQMNDYYVDSINDHDLGSPEQGMVGVPVPGDPDLARSASAITFVSSTSPPFLLMHGDADTYVSFNQSEVLFKALIDAGASAQFFPIHGAGHGPFASTTGAHDVRVAFFNRVFGFGASITPPTAVISSSATSGNIPLTISFDGSGSSDSSGTIAGQVWSFGDDQTDTNLTTSHTFTVPGTYLVMLSVRNSSGGLDCAQVAITATLGSAVIPTVSIVATDASASEVGPDTGTVTIPRTGDLTQSLFVNLVNERQNNNSSDYTSSVVGLRNITIPAGVASSHVVFTPITDATNEGTEHISVRVVPMRAYSLTSAHTATVELLDSGSGAAPVDASNPTVTILGPTDGSTWTTSRAAITLGGTASDASTMSAFNVGVASVTWSTNHGDSGTAYGTINWYATAIPTPQGSTVITVTATDYAGKSTSATLTVTSSSVVAPVFVTQPTSQTVSEPTSATFIAAASGSPIPTYQWQRADAGSSTFTDIGGATSATYLTPATSVAQSGSQFRCVATNSSSVVNSAVAVLTVTAASGSSTTGSTTGASTTASASTSSTSSTSSTTSAPDNGGGGGGGGGGCGFGGSLALALCGSIALWRRRVMSR